MSKFGTFGDYPKESLPSAEAALLTAWRSLDRYHDDGPEAAITAFRSEANANNTGYASAMAALRADFSEPNHDGPMRAAEFHPGNADDRHRVRQDVATVGRILLGK